MKREDFLRHLRFHKKCRLVFNKSNKNIYLQLIDDLCGRTICSVSTIDPVIIKGFSDHVGVNRVNALWAKHIAEILANKIMHSDITDRLIVFDVNGFRFRVLTRVIVSVLRDNGIKI